MISLWNRFETREAITPTQKTKNESKAINVCLFIATRRALVKGWPIKWACRLTDGKKNCYVSNVIHIVCFHWSFKLSFFIVALKDDLNRLKASMRWFIFGIWCIQWVYQWIYSLLYQKLINKYIYGFDNHKINEIKKEKNAHTQIQWMNDAFNAGFGIWNEINCVISTSCI